MAIPADAEPTRNGPGTSSDDDALVKLSPHELCEHPEGDYWGDRDAETRIYFGQAHRVMDWIYRYPIASDRLRVAEVRCPDRGCLLADLYRFELAARPSPASSEMSRGERYVAVTRLRSGKVGGGFCNWAFSDGWAGATHWFTASCRHGSAKLNRHWLLECALIIVHPKPIHPSVERAMREQEPEMLQGKNRGVFHPPADVWRARDAPTRRR